MSETGSRARPGCRLKSVFGADHHTTALAVDRILMIISNTLRRDDLGCNSGHLDSDWQTVRCRRAVIILLECAGDLWFYNGK
jgi:hypothetical protein